MSPLLEFFGLDDEDELMPTYGARSRRRSLPLDQAGQAFRAHDSALQRSLGRGQAARALAGHDLGLRLNMAGHDAAIRRGLNGDEEPEDLLALLLRDRY